ncbi:TauD/TfdA family dioxygenase [Amycolatopsis sp. NBC_00348]|uniref:TauD/TfdA family dioxygenase n=1 Tax=Amycolatopsis sp. NBC_00348 TaxID=2975956 RepID=UPI002E25E66F
MGRPFLPAPAELARDVLDEHGYVVLRDVGGQDSAAEVLGRIGELIPQYSGSPTHEVTYRAGNDGRSYSQSANTILAHTEAPGWDPSPAYLALYCHRQARCGGGHTDLLDVETLLPMLTEEEAALLVEPELVFPAADGRRLRTTMLGSAAGGRRLLRFSFNLLTAGDYDPPLAAAPVEGELPLGPAGRALAHRVSDLFAEFRTRILIPDDGLLVWDNQRMLHARSSYQDKRRHLTRFWVSDRRVA